MMAPRDFFALVNRITHLTVGLPSPNREDADFALDQFYSAYLDLVSQNERLRRRALDGQSGLWRQIQEVSAQ